MRSNKIIKCISLFILFVCFAPKSFSEQKLDGKLYIDQTTFKIETTLPPPFEEGSNQSKLELEVMKSMIAKLDLSQKELAIKEMSVFFQIFFQGLILINYL